MNVRSALLQLELRNVDHPNELHAAYRRMVKRWHPDQFVDQPEIRAVAEERLKQINLAYNALNQYFKKHDLSNHYFNKNRSKDIQSSQDDNKDDAGGHVRLRDWFRNAIRGRANKCQRSHTTTTKKRADPKKASRAEKSGFENIVRKTCHTPKRASVNRHHTTRRAMSISAYRRRSNQTRVGGLQPVSPISPIRPVKGIGPIDGSE